MKHAALETEVEELEARIEDDPFDAEASARLAEILVSLGRRQEAMGYWIMASQADPSEVSYRENLLLHLRHVFYGEFNEYAKDLFIDLFSTPGLDCSDLGGSWVSLLRADPDFNGLVAVKKENDLNVYDAEAFDRADTLSPLAQPFFLRGLEETFVVDYTFEQFVARLRRALLDRDARLPSAEFLDIASALAFYMARVEHVVAFSDDENEKVIALKNDVESGKGDAAAVAVLACYMPLHRLKNAREIMAAFPDLPPVRMQIAEFFDLQERRRQVQAITPIENDVSQKVQAQYEEFPYPRWQRFSKRMYNADVEGYLRQPGTQVLVAGCGTGREPMELAHYLPQAEILAVDLSTSSLAYGMGKAAQLGVKNITFRQGDINLLGSIGKTFDYICSAGVLHHMQDPEAGWRVLTGLLKPGGLMRIGLYSETARRNVVQARALIAEQGFPDTEEGIRAFRSAMRRLMPAEAARNLEESADFYHMSACRDLLFHVQEHRFTLPQLKETLDRLGLDFVRFNAKDEGFAAYRRLRPHEREATDLDVWDKVERQNPDLFAGMYQFWCRKKT